MSVTILDHALIQHKLTIMRDKNTSTYIFKQNLDEIAKLMAFEVTRNVSLKDKAIETPVCSMVGKEMDQQIILAPILRAGIGLVDGFRDIIPTAKVGHIGMERDEETLIPREYYAKFPKGLEDALVIVLDPMLATGGSANMAIENIKQRGARKIKLVCLVGAPEGVKAIQEVHPDVDITLAALDEKLSKTIAEQRIENQRNELMRSKKVALDDLFNQINEGDIKELNILIKADVQGSVEAVCSSLLGLNKNESEVRVSIVHSGVGAVTESDVMLASAANALIIAFNVRPDANARKLADTEKIDIHTYRVIYEAIDDIQAAMKGMLAPKYKEVIQGKVEIRKVMKFSKALVAGSYVLEGKVCNNSKIRIIRDNIVLYEGQIESLRRFKDDVKEVATGYECGITIDNYRDFKEGDILEVYDMEEIPQK